jgi:hypothetical protein
MSGEAERLRRWRLVLGAEAADALDASLSGEAAAMDRALDALYGDGAGGAGSRSGGLDGSSPSVARWLGDIRSYFPSAVVQVMQKDAMERMGLIELLLEPEILEEVQPDVHLVSTLLSLNRVIPGRTKETARLVVGKVVEEVEAKRLREAKHPYTQGLMRCLPSLADDVRPLPTLTRDPAWAI